MSNESDKRVGCAYCFKTLDPEDKEKASCTFVKCSRCGSIYHSECWQKSKICSQCNNASVQLINVASPSRQKTITKTRALPIKPSTVVTEEGETLSQEGLPGFLRQSIHYFAQVVRGVVVAICLLAIAVVIGVFTYRITQLSPINAENVMNALSKEAFPPIDVFVGAFNSGVIFAFVFYRHPHSNNFKNNERPGIFTHFLAGVIIILVLDILLLDFTTQDLVKLDFDLTPYEELLYAQGVTALIIVLLIPLHRNLAPLTISPKVRLSPLIIGMYGWIRFLFVCLLLNLSVVYLSMLGLPRSMNVPYLTNISLEFMDISLTLPMVGAFMTGIAVSSIAYWPPKFRHLNGHFGPLRLLLVLLCLITIGFMYRIPNNPEGYLNTITISCVAMIIAIPVQRLLS